MTFLASDAAWFFAAAVWGVSILGCLVLAVDEVRHWRREDTLTDLEARLCVAPLSHAVDRIDGDAA